MSLAALCAVSVWKTRPSARMADFWSEKLTVFQNTGALLRRFRDRCVLVGKRADGQRAVEELSSSLDLVPEDFQFAFEGAPAIGSDDIGLQ